MMSYCRWSSDNWSCDLYCYYGVCGNYITHVATNRYIGVPKNPYNLLRNDNEIKKWFAFHGEQIKFLETAKPEAIGLPYDGMSFNDPDLESFLERINCLKEAGYNVPFYVFETIEKEIEVIK